MNTNYITFLRWLFLVVITIFGAIAVNHFGFLTIIFENDPTYLTWVISSIFILMTGYCGLRSFTVSSELAKIQRLRHKFDTKNSKDIRFDETLVGKHSADLATIQKHASLKNYNQSTLLSYRASQYHDKHEIIWHTAEGLITLGLVGTVIGFVIALWPFFNLQEFSFDAVKNVLGDISGGIAVALFTTLVGLVTSIILRMQAQFLESASNTLISELAHISETDIIPILIKKEVNKETSYERFTD